MSIKLMTIIELVFVLCTQFRGYTFLAIG